MTLPPRPWPHLILVLLVLALYGRVIDFDFINYDDNVYFTENPQVQVGLTPDSVRWSFGIHGPSMWVPLTWLSHQTMVTLFGNGPAPHHLLNLILHAANAVLLFVLLQRLTEARGRSFAVAILFAIHPIHVESVAWITERKDVLSLCFCLLALLAYERYARTNNWRWFLWVILCHALAVMAKPLAVTLPCVMLLLDAWPLHRWSKWRQVLLEKIPLFLVTGVACWLTILCQQAASALGDAEQFPLSMRLANAVTSYATYLRRLFWPHDLAVPYPYPSEIPPGVATAIAVIIGLSLAALILRKRVPAFAVGWLWFLGSLVPMIGIVQAGGSKMADRYAYFTFIGLYLAVVWLASALVRKLPALRIPVTLTSCAWLALLLGLNIRQVGYWRDSEHLFERAVAVTETPYLAHNNLGLALRDAGRTQEAEHSFKTSLAIRPRYAEARNNLGILYATHGRPLEARTLLDQVVAAEPDHGIAWHNLGKVHAELGDTPRARICFSKAIELTPELAGPRYDLGTFLLSLKQWPESAQTLEALVALHPNHANAWVNLGIARSHIENPEGAEAAYQQATILGSSLGRRNLVHHCLVAGRIEEAMAHAGRIPELQWLVASTQRSAGHLNEAQATLEALLKEHPAFADAHHELGLVLGQQGNHAAAMQAFQQTLEFNPNHPAALRNFDHAKQSLAPKPEH
ncbi:tetratricopeptide repeat protein [Haloferula sp.]|uniref:tetratricopeptide repeat protein n=1 Tax=Haloferula sp. TaxID=2497595 RepID=UPI00329D36E6